MWVKAVEKAGTTDPDKVIDAIIGIEVPNLTGGVSRCCRTTTSPSRC
jgi:urea transport system substrate-binding protein